ncbi:MAG TPA: hypothetical protein VJ792_08695 [Candidatus Nitrosotalea sp.]|nr:hypothetical protein [Candidatus Nitrosotalea sp.]
MKSLTPGNDPLEFCDMCFQRGRPNLCETYKNTFTKISSVHFSQQNKLDRLLNKIGASPRMVDRRWTCTLDSSSRKEFLDSLWGIGISVHTLDDHVKILTRLYKPEVRPLGEIEKVDLPSMDSWEEFDPQARTWTPAKVSTKDGKHFAEAHVGNVLRCSAMEGTTYYRINRQEGSTALVPMEKRAAYNIICTIARPSTAHWKSDTQGQTAFIDPQDLNLIPDEIFSFLKRLGRKDKATGTLVFEVEDLDNVRAALSCVKINLEKSAETVDAANSGRSGNPIEIGTIEKERLQVMVDIIGEMGGKTEMLGDHFVISGKHGSVTATFTDEEKSTQDGNSVKISVSALEAHSRLSEILSMIRKRLGLLDVSLEISLAQHWPIINDSDLQYVVQSAISWYGSNPVLAGKIISGNNKLDKIKEWNTKIKEGKARSSLDTITLGKIIRRLEQG